ncbi:MAG: type II toxin-antitoxin system HicB family antitoxin [Candidatus Eremiobacterota bacterium]
MPKLNIKKDKYVYPAVFYYEEGKIDILFPDLPGCVSQGSNDEEALKMAKEALSLHMWGIEQDNDPVPEPTPLEQVKPVDNDCISRTVLIEVYMINIRESQDNKSMNKTVTLPRWLNKIAEEQGINFSQILQEALKEKIKV